MLTRKDYRKLAEMIHSHRLERDGKEYITAQPFITELCIWLQADNPAFDRCGFYRATYGQH